jgi:hypothetical protein
VTEKALSTLVNSYSVIYVTINSQRASATSETTTLSQVRHLLISELNLQIITPDGQLTTGFLPADKVFTLSNNIHLKIFIETAWKQKIMMYR